jgi:hypothetical protein
MIRNITIIARSGNDLQKYIPKLAKLRIEVFREFPYLYDGTLDYEQKYLNTYLTSEESIVVMVFDGEDIVGASTGLPMTDETDDFKEPFAARGTDIEKVFYCGESILKANYRGQGIYSTFMHEREEHARKMNRFDTICFCAVVRPDDHPLRPPGYQPLDAIWQKYGYKKNPDLTARYVWKDIDQPEETAKKMVFWLKQIN